MRTCIYYLIGVILAVCFAKNDVLSSHINIEVSGPTFASLHVMLNFQVGVLKSTLTGPRDIPVSFGFMRGTEVLYEWLLANGTVYEYNTWPQGKRLIQAQQDLSIALLPRDADDVTVTFYRALETSDVLDFQFTDSMEVVLDCYWSVGDGLASGSEQMIFTQPEIEQSSISGGGIAGIVIAVVVVVAIIVAVLVTWYFCWMKQQRKPRVLTETQQTPVPKMYASNVSKHTEETIISNKDVTAKDKVISVDNGPTSTTREDTTTGGSGSIVNPSETQSESSGTLPSVIEEQHISKLELSSSTGDSISESGTAEPSCSSEVGSTTPSSMRSYSVSVSESFTPSRNSSLTESGSSLLTESGSSSLLESDEM